LVGAVCPVNLHRDASTPNITATTTEAEKRLRVRRSLHAAAQHRSGMVAVASYIRLGPEHGAGTRILAKQRADILDL
jgi:hypothetical protein